MQESLAIARKSASNLAATFWLLPRAKREGMSALYAFCRKVDDIADDESAPMDLRRKELSEWRADLRRACAAETPLFPVNRELQPVIQRYKLPFEHFDALLQGVEMDLEINRYEDYERLELYCYRVASVVGLLSIEIFGYRDPACCDYAVYLGKALQLTNILRDVRADAERGRVYLPLSQLRRFGTSPEAILRLEYSPPFIEVAGSVADRARHFYRLARETLPASERRNMASAELMASVYWRLLKKLERRRFDVFGPKLTRLSKSQKLLLVLRAAWRFASGAMAPNYGI
ncbi:MAG: squalene synthase HpnD [Verrucomicrobia bacterium]|nr:MAG: squalene synthase HpnD [Verrucomicrobiota bacterium]